MLRSLLGVERPPTALLLFHNALAVGVLGAALKTWRRSFPAELSLVGYDDLEVVKHLPVPLSTVAQDKEALGRTAAELILESLVDPKTCQRDVASAARADRAAIDRAAAHRGCTRFNVRRNSVDLSRGGDRPERVAPDGRKGHTIQVARRRWSRMKARSRRGSEPFSSRGIQCPPRRQPATPAARRPGRAATGFGALSARSSAHLWIGAAAASTGGPSPEAAPSGADQRGRVGATDLPDELESLRLAIVDLATTFKAKYAGGPEYLPRMEALTAAAQAAWPGRDRPAQAARLAELRRDFQKLRQEALQALLDFIHLERHADKGSVIMIHDCLPLDQVTADRVRTTHFYSGDIWKLAMCLKSRRPDLRIRTIATGPSGLCLVSHLDRQSRVLEAQYQECLAEYVPLDFEAYRSHPERMP